MSHYPHFWNSKRGFTNPFSAPSAWLNAMEFLRKGGLDYYRLYYLDLPKPVSRGSSNSGTNAVMNSLGFRGRHQHTHANGETCDHDHEHV